jgi:hypothetical protein
LVGMTPEKVTVQPRRTDPLISPMMPATDGGMDVDVRGGKGKTEVVVEVVKVVKVEVEVEGLGSGGEGWVVVRDDDEADDDEGAVVEEEEEEQVDEVRSITPLLLLAAFDVVFVEPCWTDDDTAVLTVPPAPAVP